MHQPSESRGKDPPSRCALSSVILDAIHYRVKRVVKRSGMNICLVMKSGPTLNQF